MSETERLAEFEKRLQKLVDRVDYVVIYQTQIVALLRRLITLNDLNKPFPLGGEKVRFYDELQTIENKLDAIIDVSFKEQGIPFDDD